MRAVKSVAVQVWIALILLLLILRLFLFMCIVYHCLSFSLVRLHYGLHFASSFIYVYTYDWRCLYLCVCVCNCVCLLACVWYVFDSVSAAWNGWTVNTEHVPALYTQSLFLTHSHTNSRYEQHARPQNTLIVIS